MEIRLARFDPPVHLRLQRAAAQDQNVDRQADPDIRAHGRIHRDQSDLQRVVDVPLEAHRTVENRLSVFVLADLQEGRVLPAFDEIAGGVDHVKPHRPADDLAAEQE